MLAAGTDLLEARVAVVLVHGRGASAEDILGFARPLAAPGVAFLAPQAAVHTWYPQRFLAPFAANEPWLTSALAKLEAVRARIHEAAIPDERIVWFGFSQGACLASEFVARNPRRWGGLVAAVGGRIGPPGTRVRRLRAISRGRRSTWAAAIPIRTFRSRRVEESAVAFTRQNGEVTLRRYPGFPHSVHPEAVSFARRLLAPAS